jgi:prepilin-type N-terminal cleavage/methylation domain-containing protein
MAVRVGEKGVTLIELITAMAILLIIAAPVSLVLSQGYRDYFAERDTMEVQHQARQAMQDIMNELRGRNIVSVYVSEDGNRLTVTDTEGEVVSFSEEDGALAKNGIVILSEDMVDFTAEEVRGGEDILVNVTLMVKAGRGRDITLENSHRVKIKD